ncbi:hypothetical protein ST47_g8761 [Ascochyta rabiei]|uniref:Uncharacterized protein n=1 Tax=Didymella rabiei TaxID=5454 RepID=A0A162YIX9_DIDRA|nr:hypothetical protein ST47_g8761 [Ascochyta rabiei]
MIEEASPKLLHLGRANAHLTEPIVPILLRSAIDLACMEPFEEETVFSTSYTLLLRAVVDTVYLAGPRQVSTRTSGKYHDQRIWILASGCSPM